MAQFLEETKARWIAVDMLREEDAHLLQSVDGPYHPNIEKTREEYFAKKKAEEERALKEKAQSYYEDEWVMAKEKSCKIFKEKKMQRRIQTPNVLSLTSWKLPWMP